MIKARHVPFHVWFFNVYSRWMIRRHFRAMEIHGRPNVEGKAVLVIGNHFSWWDGFFMVEVNRRLWRKRFHVMMLEDQLEARMFLNKAGAFSIRKGSRSLIPSLQYAGEVLSDKRNMMLMFPQGKIQTHHRCSFQFEKGVETILKNTRGNPQIIFSAALVDYFSEKKPRLDIYLEKAELKENTSTRELEEKYNDFFRRKIEENDWER